MSMTNRVRATPQEETQVTESASESDMAAMSRQAHRAILNRLTAEVFTAVDNDESAVPEAARLTAWLQADFLPWAHDRQVQAATPELGAAIRGDRGVLGELADELADSYGSQAADLARAVQRDASILLARLD